MEFYFFFFFLEICGVLLLTKQISVSKLMKILYGPTTMENESIIIKKILSYFFLESFNL